MINKTELKNTSDVAINLLNGIKEDVSFLKVGATPQGLIDIIRDYTDIDIEFLNNTNYSDAPVHIDTTKCFVYYTYERYLDIVEERKKFSVSIVYTGYANHIFNMIEFTVECALDTDDISVITSHEIESMTIEYTENRNDTINSIKVSSK